MAWPMQPLNDPNNPGLPRPFKPGMPITPPGVPVQQPTMEADAANGVGGTNPTMGGPAGGMAGGGMDPQRMKLIQAMMMQRMGSPQPHGGGGFLGGLANAAAPMASAYAASRMASPQSGGPATNPAPAAAPGGPTTDPATGQPMPQGGGGGMFGGLGGMIQSKLPLLLQAILGRQQQG